LTNMIKNIKEEQINEVGDTAKGKRAINAVAHRADDEITDQSMKSRPNKKKLNKALRAASLAIDTDERRGGKVLNSYIKSRYGLDEEQLNEKATEAQRSKVEKVMREFKKRKLHSGSKEGPMVTNPKQAIAIALNQAGLSKNNGDKND